MEEYLAFLVPKDADLAPLKFEIPMFTWGGVDYPQGPHECMFGDNFKLTYADNNELSYIKRHLPFWFKIKDWQPILVTGKGVNICWGKHWGHLEEEQPLFTLLDLIKTILTNQKRWVVMFKNDPDAAFVQINGEIEDVYNQLMKSVKCGYDFGIVVCSKN